MNHQWVQWVWLGFAFIFGSVFGSFINVVIYRLPVGISLTNPMFSFCPKCKHTLAWWENVPILAWFYLRARCTVCRQTISPVYPAIESLTACLFAVLYWACYISPLHAKDFAHEGFAGTWPVFVVYLVLVAAMIAATVIDAKLYIIPLEIPWFVTGVALVILPLGYLLVGNHLAPYDFSVSPQVSGLWLGAALGGAIGLIVALGLLRTGILPQSFADEDEAHDAILHHHVVPGESAVAPQNAPGVTALQESPQPPAQPEVGASAPSAAVTPEFPSPVPASSAVIALSSPDQGPATQAAQSPAAAPTLGPDVTSSEVAAAPQEGSNGSTASDPAVNAGVPPAGNAEPSHQFPQTPEEIEAWCAHPHLDREMLKECLFVAFPLVGFILGALLYQRMINPHRPPLTPDWVQILAGVVCGYLVGGGMIWITRIGGTFAFRKEAMGLGDVHFLAAIGAVLGPTNVVLVFFIAPFLGLAYAAIALVLGRVLKGHVHIVRIPYGPYLALASVILMIFSNPIWGEINSWMVR